MDIQQLSDDAGSFVMEVKGAVVIPVQLRSLSVSLSLPLHTGAFSSIL